MVLQIITLIALLLTGLGAGLFFHAEVGGNPAYKDVSAKTFVEYHQRLDSYMTKRMPPFFLTGVAFIVTWLFMERANWQSFAFIMVALAFVFSILEIIIMFIGNRPINFLIQTYSLDNIPNDWATQRDKWISYIHIRTVTGILTFACLLLATIFGHS